MGKMTKKSIGFRRSEETTGEKNHSVKSIMPIGFLRQKKYTLSEEIDQIIDKKFDPESTIHLVAEKMIDAFNKMTAPRAQDMNDQYDALKRELKLEIRKIGKMNGFKELVKEVKKLIDESEEPTEELAKLYKNVGMCEYIIGKKKLGVKDLSCGIMTLLCIDEVEEASEEIKNVVSLSAKEKYKDSEKVLKTLFKEMVDSQHPYAMTMAGVALASFYEQNKQYKEAADVCGSILIVCQTNLQNEEVAEIYTHRVLPAFIEYKKKAGEDVMRSLFIAFDDMYYIAARKSELRYLERLREIIKIMWNEKWNEKNRQTPEETKEMEKRFEEYVELFNMRKKMYIIGEHEFFVDEIKKFFENKRKASQKFE